MSDDWNPSKKYRRLVRQISDILDDGGERTVRDVYYALEARGYEWNYRQVSRAVKRGRRSGYLNPAQIVDASRPPEVTPRRGYNDTATEEYVSQQLDNVAEGYFEDWWAEQEAHVEVWVEKQSLASVFAPICDRWNVRLEATRGDWSDSKVYETAQRLLGGPLDRGQDVTILYFGDYNPSGYHAPVGVQHTLQYYGLDLKRDGVGADDPRYFEIAPDGRAQLVNEDGDPEGTILFNRIALNTEHIERFDLPTNPSPSSSDKDKTIRNGFMTHVTGGRDVNVELNALKEFRRDYLENLIEDAITEHLDDAIHETVKQRTQRRREEIRGLLNE